MVQRASQIANRVQIGLHHADDEVPGRVVPLVEKQRGHQRLESARQVGLAPDSAQVRLALAHYQPVAEVQTAADLRERRLVHERSAHLRQVTLGTVREPRDEILGHDQVENSVAQELEAFVRLFEHAGELRDERIVHKGLLQQRDVDERDSKRFLQLAKLFGGVFHCYGMWPSSIAMRSL